MRDFSQQQSLNAFCGQDTLFFRLSLPAHTQNFFFLSYTFLILTSSPTPPPLLNLCTFCHFRKHRGARNVEWKIHLFVAKLWSKKASHDEHEHECERERRWRAHDYLKLISVVVTKISDWIIFAHMHRIKSIFNWGVVWWR